ncbi:MAG: hypothetical protein AAFN10_15540 [Bacteroidota bacterium]
MRNRKLNRGLVPLVVLVWALLGYRFWYEAGPQTEDEITEQKALAPEEIRMKRDTFSLSLPFRDPFLDKSMVANERSPKEQKITKRAQAIPPIPNITYKGSLQAAQRLGLIVWNGKSHTVWPKQRIHNAKISHIDPQYIDLTIEGKSYRIKRGKSIGAG